jgi:predicted lipoprotein with Yx(FWY)xxD motif
MNSIRTSASLAALAAAVVLVASACGGSGDSGASAPAPGGSGPARTVSVDSIAGVGKVLVDANGAALYAADQEAKGHIVCTDSCTTIWQPLTLGGSKSPTGEGAVSTELGTIERPDGDRQVTFDGRPLYRFSEDPDAGVVTGNGFEDTFDGHAFTWHVATSGGISMTSSNSSTSAPGY